MCVQARKKKCSLVFSASHFTLPAAPETHGPEQGASAHRGSDSENQLGVAPGTAERLERSTFAVGLPIVWGIN